MPDPQGNQDPNAGASGNQDPNVGVVDWKADLDPAIKDHACLANFKDIKDVVKSYVNVQPLIGKEKIPVPGEKATKEEWDVVYSRLGRPGSPKDYKLPDIKLPEGMPAIQDAKLDVFKQKAHELGLSAKQTAGLFEWYLNDTSGEFRNYLENRDKSMHESEVKLRQDWGKGYEAKIQTAKRVLDQFGDDSLKEIIESGLGNDPAFIKFLASIGSKMSEDGIFLGKGESAMTPEEASAEIKKIQGDSKHPYFNKMHPEHQLAVKRMQDLFEMAFPEKSKS